MKLFADHIGGINMLFDYLTTNIFIVLQDIVSMADIFQLELLNIPTTVINLAYTFLSISLFFIPASTFPIFLFIPTYWLAKIIIATVTGLFSFISTTPILRKLI